MKVITYSALRSDITEEATLVSRIHSRALALLTAVTLVSPPSRTPARTTATPSPPPRTSTRRRPSGQTTRSSSNPSSQAQRLPWTTLLRGLEKVTGATAGINTSSRCPKMASSTFLAHQARLTTPHRLLPGDPNSQFGWGLGPTLGFPWKLSAITPPHSTFSQ